ncbi:CHD3-type chromatin-remodeling factor PICKLE [Cryptomeria japonica]|uniref:CHD3-type chromatin-remodeling factor PICKLE n=1 Tax=Cryptomeria japonica TaxID=3369 RepID=UPI0027DA5FC3|nr:CHD3-type chromatin-remodeling factor PICKLE [Cryptomeria japonica]
MAKSDDSSDDSKSKEEVNCMAERLRIRSGKKPSYNEADEMEDDADWKEQEEAMGHDTKQPTKIIRSDASDDSCYACGGSGKLLCCDTCTAVYHLKCLTPPLKLVPRGNWSCPQCVNPLQELDKILDCQMRPVNDGNDEGESSTKKLVKQYLVKWKSMSYLHCSWVPYEEFQKSFKEIPRIKTRMNNFNRQMDSMKFSEDDWVPIRPEWTTVDRIISSRLTGELREYLVKWKELQYDECTWEVEEDISAFRAEIERFNSIKARGQVKMARKRKGSASDGKEAKRRRKDFEQYDQTPDFLTGGTLHPYQLEGLNFLRFAWLKETHVILADEMGLGKTVQSISFLASLIEEDVTYPHLVVAPLSTLRNWEREFATWAPQMNVVMYVGSAPARSMIRQYEFYHSKKGKLSKKHKGRKKSASTSNQSKQERIKFDVLLTSYEMINFDTAVLKPIKWECMIVDEGHRLKNKDSKLFQTLTQYSAKHRVLLTGTPLQNNLDELFMLMHFLDAGKFGSLEEFQHEFKDISQEEQVGRLHKMLAPHLLRRVKKDVMKDLPPKKELILRVELSSMQKEYYKAILTRNYHILSRRGGPQISLNNVVMELRKICAHPYMLEGVEPQISNAHEAYRQLLEASGKLYLLDKMMVKLKEQGHRVLIYSQFQHMLDILEDYLSYKKWSYERIDGRVNGVERQIRIDRFNAPNSARFCFILSTRAGGLGINLATADTVIIYDSDWNPHADLQAMARAHRLGQINKVMIFRLVNRGTIDERMMQLTKKKMILEHLVVGRLKTQVLNQEELDDILRYGAKELFADENDESGKARQIHYDDAAIDRLLDRSLVVSEEAVADEEEENGFLKAFKVANFEYIDKEEAEAARAEEARKQAEADRKFAEVTAAERAKYWDDLLKDKYVEQKVETFTELGKGKRSRKQLVATEEDDLAGLEDVSSDDDEEDQEADWMEAEPPVSGKGPADPSARKPQSSRKRTRGDPPPLMERDGKSFRVLGFSQNQRTTFVQILMRFGLGNYDWSEFIPRMKQKTPEEIKEYATLFLSHISEEITESSTFSDGVPKEGLRIQDVLVRLALLHLIGDKVTFLSENPGVPLFSNDIYSKFPGLKKERYWKEEHDCRLLQAILKHGFGRWQAIAEDYDLRFQEVIRMELQLPLVNSSALGASIKTDAGVPPAAVNKDPQLQEYGVEGHVKPLSGVISANVASEIRQETAASAIEKGNQLNQSGLISSENSREVQRRLVEFIRKRVSLLEKALNIEYYKELIASHKESETEFEEPEQEPLLADVPSPVNQQQTEMPSSNSPLLLPIGPEEVLRFASDNEPNRLEIARLYNEMCKVINDNEQESIQTYTGNKSAGLRLRRNLRPLDNFCEEVRKILKGQQITTDVPGLNQLSPPSEIGDDADARSDDPEHDPGPGIEVNSDSKQQFTHVKGSPKKSGVPAQTTSPVPSAVSVLSQGSQTGQEKKDKGSLLTSPKTENQDPGVIVLDD